MEFPELDALQALACETRAAELAAYHKAPRVYLGVANPQLDALVQDWRAERDVPARVELAAQLWQSDVFEARIAAAKLLTQARLRPDEAAWALILTWVPDFDGAAIADQAMKAADRRLQADPARLDQIEPWLEDPNPWVRRAALVATLPWTRLRNPKPEELAQRVRLLDWLRRLADDRDTGIQKAIGGWLRDLSKHEPQQVRDWLDADGARLKPVARSEAGRWLKRQEQERQERG